MPKCGRRRHLRHAEWKKRRARRRAARALIYQRAARDTTNLRNRWPSPQGLKFVAVELPGSATQGPTPVGLGFSSPLDRKSTRLNSSHANISYAVFCLKKKKKHNI